jgi:hypothetical protein
MRLADPAKNQSLPRIVAFLSCRLLSRKQFYQDSLGAGTACEMKAVPATVGHRGWLA